MNRLEYLELIIQAYKDSVTRAKKAEQVLASVEKELANRDIDQVSTEALLQYKALFAAIGLVEDKWQSSCHATVYEEAEKESEIQEKKKNGDTPQNRSYEKLGIDPFWLQFGQELLPLFDEEKGGTFCEELGQFRHKLIDELGYVFPDVRVLDSYTLGVNEYAFYIRSHKIASGNVYPDRVMLFPELFEQFQIAMPQDVIVDDHSIYAGLEVHWFLESSIPEELKRHAQSPVTVICSHLREVLIQFADEVVSHLDTAKLLELVRQQHSALIQELTPALIPITTIREVIAGLLCERVSIKDIMHVVECITKHAHDCKDPETILERVRGSLGRTIVAGVVSEPDSKFLSAITLPADIEEKLNNNTRTTEDNVNLHDRICNELMKTKTTPQRQLIICSPEVRLIVFRLIVPTVPDIAVMTMAEIPVDMKVTWLN